MASVPTFYSYRRSFTVYLRERGSDKCLGLCAGMAQMAELAIAKGEDDLGAVQPPSGQVPAGATPDHPCHLKLRSEAVSRRAGCGKSARPDPWGARPGNRLGLPDNGGTRWGLDTLRARTPMGTLYRRALGQMVI
jgi:hypothetical protein